MDESKSRIPVLSYKAENCEKRATSNEEKSNALVKSFFLSKLQAETLVEETEYNPCCKADCISTEHIRRQLHRIKPYKASEPDSIPNIVLTKSADLLLDRLNHIYMVIYKKKLQYKPWKQFTTIVLCKPSKLCYKSS